MIEKYIVLIVFFTVTIYTILVLIGNQKSKCNKLRVGSIILTIIGFIAMVIFGFITSINKINRSTSTSFYSRADGFTIREYKIVMNVDESCSVDVKEYITVNFYETGHHGIYRFIPEWLEYTNKEGVTQSREAKLTNLKAVGDKYTVDTVKGKKRIKIGDANYFLPIGNHTYKIEYNYNMGNDPYENFDELIFHAFGDYWGTRINNASVEIHLPKSFDAQNNIKFFADKHRINDITSYVNYYVEGNTIYANLSSDYRLNSSLTLDIELPEGYFVNGSNNYGIKSLILCVFCIVFAIISFILWNKNGQDIYKVPETVEFYPPENLDAAEIGYLYKRDTGRKLSIALIVELASKGFIKIMETEDKKIQIVKSRNIDESTEKTNMSENEKYVYNYLFEDSDETILSDNVTFYQVFSIISQTVIYKFDDIINDLKAYKYKLICSLGFLICTINWGLAYSVFEDLNPKFGSIYTIAFFSNIITFIFSILMKRKNYYGEQLKAKIIGFRNYIELAEKDQLEALVEKNPNYFYDILPYAYVLDVSKKWIEKFEKIPIPNNDMGTFNYSDYSFFDTLSSSVYYPSSSGGSSSGCSSCGGGCSSCGGGCSSCGGGGSW